MNELFKDISVKIKVVMIFVLGVIGLLMLFLALPVFITAVQQGRSITLIPPTIGAYADPSIQKCAEVVRNTNEATKTLTAELARLSELADKQQQDLFIIHAKNNDLPNPQFYTRTPWETEQQNIEDDLRDSLSKTRSGMINAVNQQRDYIIGIGKYCIEQE